MQWKLVINDQTHKPNPTKMMAQSATIAKEEGLQKTSPSTSRSRCDKNLSDDSTLEFSCSIETGLGYVTSVSQNTTR